jgi:hypothetical protein
MKGSYSERKVDKRYKGQRLISGVSFRNVSANTVIIVPKIITENYYFQRKAF